MGEGNPESFSLRPATPDDLEPVLHIEHKVHLAPWSEDGFKTELTKPFSQFLVLSDDETDTRIAGYLIFWLLLDECQILNVVVDLPFRGLGLAQKMISHVIAQGVRKGFPRVTLEVRRSNLAAIQLYQKMNFTISLIRKRFYSDGEDAYQMTLDLQGKPDTF